MCPPGRVPAEPMGDAANAFPLESFTPRSMFKTFLGLMLQSADFLQQVAPPCETGTILTEFRNKLQAFYVFEYVDSVLGLTSDRNLTLPQMIERASTLGPFFSVWATEGLGHYYTSHHLNELPEKFLSSAAVQHLPRERLVPLYAGMGLALAESVLAEKHAIKTLAERFSKLCHNNARPEYLGCSLEALGLVVRNLRPDLIADLDRELVKGNAELLAYFWHGVGRGIYFMLPNLLPYWSGPWQGYEMCLEDPPHPLGRVNAASGFAWALTLVNIREPEIVAAFLKHHQARLANDDAFANGVFSALVIWLESAPQDSSVREFCEYNVEQKHPSLFPLWDRYVLQPAQDAQRFSRRSTKVIGDLFRYQPAYLFG